MVCPFAIGKAFGLAGVTRRLVTPAQAGVQESRKGDWIPALAPMTEDKLNQALYTRGSKGWSLREIIDRDT